MARRYASPTLPATDGMSGPVASMNAGDVSAFFEATELREHADVTVSDRKPGFTTTATETTKRVRGHAGTLRTVDVSPAKQLTLFWKESANRWITLATDDTYTPDEVVGLADALTGARVAVLPPFDLSLSPAGLLTDTVSASRMTFRAPGASTAGLSTVLRQRRQLTGADRKNNGYDAVLTRRSGKVTLSIDVADWDATLEVAAGNGLTVTDSDLIRFATGVRRCPQGRQASLGCLLPWRGRIGGDSLRLGDHSDSLGWKGFCRCRTNWLGGF